MSVDENKAVVLRYFLESHNPPYNLDVIDETCIPEYAEVHRHWQQMERAALPDKEFTIEDVIAEGDKVVLRWTIHGTHLGEFATPLGSVPATGRRITLTSTATYRLAGGRIDWLHLLQQFGAEMRLPTSPAHSRP